MHYDYSVLWFCMPGLILIGHGVRGILRRRITTSGRGGRGSTYVGRAAALEGLFVIAIGFVFIAASAMCLMESAHA